MNTENILAKKILVTGGAGFIGSNIIDHLVSLGHKHIVVLDNLETGALKNIEAHIASGSIKFIQGDIRDYNTCLNATGNIDVVLHQAALGSVPRSIKNPMDTNATNLSGFINVLEASRANGVKRFVYASSSSVYGDDRTLPKREAHTGTPLSPYAVTKKANELYANVYAALHGMEIIGLRYFNVFGPKQNPSGPYAAVIPIFINNLLSNKDCLIFGDGENKRDFTFIDNVVQANLLAASTDSTQALGQVYNIAFGSTLSVNSLFSLIKKDMGIAVEPVYKPARVGEITDSFADIDKAAKHLNYNPTVSIADGIKKTISWYQQNSI